MKECVKCKEILPIDDFDDRFYTLVDGSVTKTKRSHCRTCQRESNRLRYHNNKSTKEAHRKASYKHRIKKYGLTIKEYDELYSSQDGKCYICNIKPDRQLNIDHCHQTGKVRKLLCAACNTALGHSKEDIEILKSLIRYLEEHNE